MEILPAIISLAAGLLGALIGGYATKWATEAAYQNNLKLQEEARSAALNRVLQGIRAEVETLWKIYNDKFGKAITSLEDGGIVKDEYPLHLYQGYFVVYDNNCSLIGQLPDDELRESIIMGYLKARELIDAYIHNNSLLQRRDELISKKSNIYDEDIKSVETALKENADYIRRVHTEVEKFYETTKVRLSDLDSITGVSNNSLNPMP